MCSTGSCDQSLRCGHSTRDTNDTVRDVAYLEDMHLFISPGCWLLPLWCSLLNKAKQTEHHIIVCPEYRYSIIPSLTIVVDSCSLLVIAGFIILPSMTPARLYVLWFKHYSLFSPFNIITVSCSPCSLCTYYHAVLIQMQNICNTNRIEKGILATSRIHSVLTPFL